MKVKARLNLGLLVTTFGIALIVAISAFAILKIGNAVSVLTEQSTPMQVKTLMFQQIVERLSADFLRLGLAGNPDEVSALSGSIDANIGELERLGSEMQALGGESSSESAGVFGDVRVRVVRAVDQRMSDLNLFRSETTNVNGAIKTVEVSVSGIRGKISRLSDESTSNLKTAQRSSLSVNTGLKKMLVLQSRLKDLEIIINDVEDIKSKYKLAPLKEKMKSLVDTIQGIQSEAGDPPAVAEVKEGARRIYQQITADETGLLPMMTRILEGRGNAGEYNELKASIVKGIDALTTRVAETIDPYEMQIVRSRQSIDKSFAVQGSTGRISQIGSEISLDLKEFVAGIRLVMLSARETEFEDAQRDIGAVTGRIDHNVSALRKALKDDGQTQMLQDMDNIDRAMKVVAVSTGKILDAKRRVLKSDADMQNAVNQIKSVTVAQSLRGQQQARSIAERQSEVVGNVRSTVRMSLTLIIAASIAVFLAFSIINVKITRSITEPLTVTEDVVESIGGGDLTKRIGIVRQDEIGMMCESFNRLADTLNETISEVSEKASIIESSAETIFRNAEAQASFSMQLSSSVTEISSTMEEFSVTSYQIAENSSSVANISNRSLDNARTGAEEVSKISVRINEINEQNTENLKEIMELGKKSKEITRIMDLIKKIADQTKLIAFNAALEASSAGEYGKRFAVVSAEIRRLADSVTESTDEISGKVKDILDGVNRLVISSETNSRLIREGVDQSNGTVEILNSIVSVAEEANLAATNISNSTEQQKIAGNQVSTALREIAAGTQELSESMVQISSISKDFATLSEDMVSFVRRFRLK